MPAFASEVKTEWAVDPKGLTDHARRVSDLTCARLARQGIEDIPALLLQKPPEAKLRDLPEDTWKLLLKNCISPLPLHKTLVLMEVLEKHHEQKFWKHEPRSTCKGARRHGEQSPFRARGGCWQTEVRRASGRGVVELAFGTSLMTWWSFKTKKT